MKERLGSARMIFEVSRETLLTRRIHEQVKQFLVSREPGLSSKYLKLQFESTFD